MGLISNQKLFTSVMAVKWQISGDFTLSYRSSPTHDVLLDTDHQALKIDKDKSF